MITCNKCSTDKEDSNFRHKRKVCKDCERDYGRKYRRENKEKSKKWVEENKEKMKELQKNWYKKNKEKINNTFNLRYNNVESDFKKIKNYRTAISHMISGHQKTNKYIGCNSKHLIEWLTFCFEDGMTLENYGSYWTIDHIIPIDTYKSDTILFNMLVKWNNIKPVLKEFNLKKNKYVNYKQIEKHINDIRQFYNKKNIEKDENYENYLRNTLLRETP
jgi:5-methylcytosine-specific restriction endonuclease McrA